MRAADGALVCDHCGDEIPQMEHRHTWVGPVPLKGEAPRHYHLAREYPDCRAAGGIEFDPPEDPRFVGLMHRVIRGLEASG